MELSVKSTKKADRPVFNPMWRIARIAKGKYYGLSLEDKVGPAEAKRRNPYSSETFGSTSKWYASSGIEVTLYS